MIKLYNNSKVSFEVLLPILKQAYKLASIQGKIVVVVTRGRHGKGLFYRSKTLQYKRHFKSNRFIKSDAGFVVIWPELRTSKSTCDRAKRMCEVILHEFKHSQDYQQKAYFGEYHRNHDNRPHEIRANRFDRYEVFINESLIQNLTTELENLMYYKHRNN